ncbi:2-succinyl-5-enolpyruvyl-6-hydroxy-3-cyclohexene-1-carboxylic-acid synthase [Natronorarus salvus]|uniref:2-succinyl-5-enolpyruvyl-6-hydroxy-3- cyclohexene-1-carboxylic-acid synthase n=1 Tax=Natronorarus salvus TaxID=3117733 RepID=UPI002F269578
MIPNRNVLWGRAIADEVAKAGIDAVCISPGSRSTPLTVAFAEHEGVDVFSHLDERSAAFFALGRAKATGRPTPLVCTSGTAAANFHPAVIEASQARVPMVLLTADRPPELRDSGANQTIDQEKLYGDAVRWYRDLPEPEADDRKLRSLRTDIARAIWTAEGMPSGPVHLNVPFGKPLEPTEVPDDVPERFSERFPLAADGRDGPFVTPHGGTSTLGANERRTLERAIGGAERGLIVAGPSDTLDPEAVSALATATGFPVLADPLSGVRYGPHVAHDDVLVCGAYDSYLDDRVVRTWPDPDLVLRVGAPPTSKTLQLFLRDSDARQVVVDPAGEWREARFGSGEIAVVDPNRLCRVLAEGIDGTPVDPDWRERFSGAEIGYWKLLESEENRLFEGAILARAFDRTPEPCTVFVSNSMPIRDADRFARPRTADLSVLGNRGASGIDGIASSALGAGSASKRLVLVTGDVAFYHDANGLLALSRCGVDATVVLVNNDGGGIFHMLPIESFDPPFTSQFKTPHGLDFEPLGALYGFEFERVESVEAFEERYTDSLASSGTQVIEVSVESEASHRTREAIQERVVNVL